MRKLFARVTGSVNGSKRDHESDLYDAANMSPVPLSPSRLRTSEESMKYDLISELILDAARALLAAVQEILYDTASLQENMSGFHRLLSILNEKGEKAHKGTVEKMHENRHEKYEGSTTTEDEAGSLDVLLSNLKHPLFTEKCNEVGLATALMHALRLLRMYEIKLAKNIPVSSSLSMNVPASSSPKKSVTQGATFLASKRLCLVFSTLLADHRSTEKIRQSLVKLVTFPLSALPERGINTHIMKTIRD